jgi:hypothetical protein
VVVVATVARGDRTQLLVAPVTHSPPARDGEAIEIPANVKLRLGLDRQRSWIVLTELNRFFWRGPDVRVAPGRETPIYDAIPDWLFYDVRAGVLRHSQAGRLAITKRTE